MKNKLFKKIFIIWITLNFIGGAIVLGYANTLNLSKKNLDDNCYNVKRMSLFGALLNEDFSGTFPPDGWLTDSWIQYNSSYNYLENPCACLYKYNQVNNNSAYITSKTVDASECEKCLLKFNFGCDVQYDNFCYFNVKLRRNSTSPWVDITPWENPLPGDMNWNNYEIEIINITEGCGDGLQINWTYKGFYFYYNYFWLDDVKIIYEENGNTLYVGGTGEGNYTSIQNAIDNANEGNTVFVYDESSPYYENINVNKLITLKGENRTSAIIDGSGINDVVNISADGVVISGFTIQNSGKNQGDSGIKSHFTNNISIIDNNIVDNIWGISLFKSLKGILKENNIIFNEVGIWIHYSSVNTSKNIIKNNLWRGIYLFADDNIIINNIFSGNITDSYGDEGIEMEGENNIISGNIITRFHTGICLHTAYNNQIIENNISSNRGFIWLDQSNNNLISKNNFINNEDDGKSRIFSNSFFNKWQSNYWNKTRKLPYLIIGDIWIDFFGDIIHFKWYNVDWHPAKIPYDSTNEIKLERCDMK
jgi:parallel beta-helix repeat protein